MKQLLATSLLLAVVGIVGCGEKKPAPKAEPPKTDAPATPPADAPADPAKTP